MSNSIIDSLLKYLKRCRVIQLELSNIDILSAFIKDFVHELLAVITAMQANVDLLEEPGVKNSAANKRINIIKKSINRLLRDTRVLTDVFRLSGKSKGQKTVNLEKLIKEVTDETNKDFQDRNASLCSDIAKNVTFTGDPVCYKKMIREIVLAILSLSKNIKIVNLVASTSEKAVSIKFFDGESSDLGVFQPWRLGELRLTPTNGDGIMLSAVDAMARLNSGNLNIRNLPDLPRAFQLKFNVHADFLLP